MTGYITGKVSGQSWKKKHATKAESCKGGRADTSLRESRFSQKRMESFPPIAEGSMY
ncbi:MAG: hypothetical protein HFG54_11285 [Lachnospiraceae bacterium]|nr:hypothetical protein [Lachnospiraceae bacterium]